MASSMVRVNDSARMALKALAEQSGETMGAVLEKAIECYRRQRILEQANCAYAALRKDPQAWREETEERQAWAGTLADELDGDGNPPE